MAKRKAAEPTEPTRTSKRKRVEKEAPKEHQHGRHNSRHDSEHDFSDEEEEEEEDPNGFPHAYSIASYREEDQDKLKQEASWEMEMLLNLAGILRDPVDPEPQPKQAPQKGKGKTKGKSKAKLPDDPQWLPGWEFYREGHVRRGMTKFIQPQLDYIQKMKAIWRPVGEKLEMPEDWFQEETTIVLANNRPWDMDKYDREKVNKTRMSFYTEPISEHLERIPTKTLIRRHLSTRLGQAIKPDWCLHSRPIRPDDKPTYTVTDAEYRSNIEIYPSIEKWLDILNMPMGEHNVEITFMTFFTNLPSMWMLMTPQQSWLDILHYDMPDQRIEFALVRESVRPFSREDVEILRDIPISYSHPAVFLAMKGPGQWPDHSNLRKWDQPFHFDTDEWREMTEDDRLGFCVENLACAVQPSLDALVLNWFLRCEQEATRKRRENYEEVYPIYPPAEEGESINEFLPNPKDEETDPDVLEYSRIPEWAWIPGILYDYDNCYLVAHIPVLPDDPDGPVPVSYVSYLIDTISIPRVGGDDDDRLCLVERVRLCTAWICLAKHACKVTSMWDSVVQPLETMRYEEIRDFKESKYGIPGRPPSESRVPVRVMHMRERDDAYHRSSKDAEGARKAYNIDMDEVFETSLEEERIMEEENERARPIMKERVTPKIERWLATLKNEDTDFYLLGVNQDEELPEQYYSDEEYPADTASQ